MKNHTDELFHAIATNLATSKLTVRAQHLKELKQQVEMSLVANRIHPDSKQAALHAIRAARFYLECATADPSVVGEAKREAKAILSALRNVMPAD